MKLLYIDLFCGAGGTSTGVETAKYEGDKCAKVIACVNHDANAIASHASNHPGTLHFTEDIRTLDLTRLIKKVEHEKTLYPDAYIVLWASLECTNFSKAKGGLPRDADSRTLAEHLFRYIEAINPDFIQIENVEEFMSWGELDENGKPVSKDKGRDFIKWLKNVCKYGYHTDHRILNSADFGAYTSRKRLFILFAKHDLPIVFPTPTHCKGGAVGMFNFKKWKPVKEVLDFTDEGESIFTRKKPLVEATLKRIYAGLIKFVAGGKNEYLLKYNSMSKRGKYIAPGVDDPCPTISTQGRLNVVQCISAKENHSFISAYYGNGDNVHSIEGPAPTVTTKDRLAFVDMAYGNGFQTGINDPVGTITANPKHHMVTCKPWVMNTNFNNIGSSVDDPAQTVTANRKWPYLMTTIPGTSIQISESDSEMMVKIKEFMIMYGIIDIKMRMLRIKELKQIMGFPEDYVLIGTQAEQKKYIGNAVEVTIARAICEALVNKLHEIEQSKIAI